jgi:hypothetical protein
VVTGVTKLVLRVLAVAALGISAYVHIHLAPRYAYPGTISGDQLFYLQGSIAALIGLVLLVTGNRWAWAAAAMIGVASFAAVMLYRYVDVGAIGPLPNMNDPTWQPSPDKLLSAIAEAFVPFAAMVQLTVGRRVHLRAHALQPAGS